MDIENSSQAKKKESNTSYANVPPENSSQIEETKGFKGKLQSLKSLIKFPSFTSKDSGRTDITTSNDTTIQSTQEDVPKVKTCKDKIEQKIIDTVEVEKNIAIFLMLIALGCGLLCLSLFLIPLIITSPSKFSLCFAMGSLLVLISFLFYHGTKAYIKSIFAPKRLWISILFILSIFIGVGFALGNHYIISILCSLCQLVTLIVFILSFVPGGQCGIDCIKKTITSPFTGLWMRMAASQISNS